MKEEIKEKYAFTSELVANRVKEFMRVEQWEE